MSMNIAEALNPTLLKKKPMASKSKEKREYLTTAELKNVVPKGKKIYKVDEIDKRYEFYYVGYVPPEELTEEEKKGVRAVYWYDLGQDVVKKHNQGTNEWELAPPDVPKFAADFEKEDLVGIVEDDDKASAPVSVPKSIADIRNLDI